MSAWIFFFSERVHSPDFKGMDTQEKVKLVSAEWKALDPSEKKVCCDHVHVRPVG
jgi:hypothetical protein